jgi:hypothetical protein
MITAGKPIEVDAWRWLSVILRMEIWSPFREEVYKVSLGLTRMGGRQT